MFDVWLSGLYLLMFCISQWVLWCRFVKKRSLMPPFFPTSQISIYVGWFTICLYLMYASAGMTSWMTQEFHSYLDMEVSYLLRKVTTGLWMLVNIRRFPHHLYTFLVQPFLYGNNLALSIDFPLAIILCEPLLHRYT